MRHIALEIPAVNGDKAALTELEVIAEDGSLLTKDTWEVAYVSSEVNLDKGNYAENVIDGNFGTRWEIQKTAKSECIIIDLGEIQSIKGIRLHQGNVKNGSIKQLNVYGRPQFFLSK